MNFRLRYVLALSFILIAAIPVVLLGSWVEKATLDREMATVSEKHLLLAKNLTGALDRYAEDSKAIFEFLVSDSENGRLTKAGRVLGTKVGLTGFWVANERGHVSLSWDDTRNLGKAFPASTLERLKSNMSANSTFSDVLSGEGGQATLFLTRQLSADKFALAALNLDFIRKVQKSITFGRMGHSAIVDRNGNLMAHPLPGWQDSMKNISKVKPVALMMGGDTGVTIFYSPAKEKDMITGYATVPSTGWGVMVPQPLEELEARADQVSQMANGLIIIGLMVAGAIGWLLSGLLVRPVDAVINASRDIANGNLQARVPILINGAPAEFQELGSAFNIMANSIATTTRERKQVEEDRSKALVSAQNSDQAKTDFLANMSHELRSPLNSIIGFSDILRAEILGPLGHEKYIEYADDIYQSGDHLLELINDILDISKIEARQLELSEDIIDLNELVKSCIKMLREQANAATVVLSLVTSSEPPQLVGDRIRIKQIMLNLLYNAIKFTPYMGKVKARVYVDNKSTVLQVCDTGVGIAKEDLQKVIAPFQQVQRNNFRFEKSTGLGVYLCKQLTEMHGGTLSIESEIDKGTIVTVRFPPERTLIT